MSSHIHNQIEQLLGTLELRVSALETRFKAVRSVPVLVNYDDPSTYATLELAICNYSKHLPLIQDLAATPTLHMLKSVQEIPRVKQAMKEIGMRHMYEWFLPQTKERIRAAAIEKGWLSPKDQQDPSLYFVPGLRAKAWWPHGEFNWIDEFERNYRTIKDELLNLRNIQQRGWQESQYTGKILAENGNWTSFYFYQAGNRIEKNCQMCPKTIELLEKYVPINKLGTVSFSALTPGSHIKAHYGEITWELRCQMPLLNVEGCQMRVGSVVRDYVEGKAFLFDDTYIHEVWNNNEPGKAGTRIVLLFDFIHPDFSADEKRQLETILSTYAIEHTNYAQLEQQATQGKLFNENWWK